MRELNEQIINSLSSGVIALDRTGTVITANPAASAYLGVAPDTLRPGACLADLEHAKPLAAVLHEVMRTGETVSRHEITLTLGTGRVRQIGLSASLLEGPEPYNGVIVLFTDMTERRRLERADELNRQLAALGELTAGVVHELRNPVSVISGMAELLLRKLDVGDDRHKVAQTILREAAALERTIAQFLGFARPFELETGPCSPADIVERTLQLCRRHAERKSAVIQCDASPAAALRADAYRVAQALANILNNAIDAVAPGGRITFRTHQDGEFLVFEIADDGPGLNLVPGEDLFAPFFTKKEGGTGLGLTIAHRVITAHHGSVSYGNRPEGGASFAVRLPLAGRADAQRPRPK